MPRVYHHFIKMPPEDLVKRAVAQLEELADPAFAEQLQWFFRKEIADPYGVRSPQLKRMVGPLYREMKSWPAADRNRFCEALWKTGRLEAGVLVCHLYRRFGKQTGAREFGMFERWLGLYVNNWAHTDGVASWLMAAAIENEPALIDRLPPWTRSQHRWKRRGAAVALIQEAKHGRHTDRILEIATLLIGDPDDMVQKGVGWLLKVAYAKKPREIVAFLEKRKATTPRLILRYAAEKMNAADRRAVLDRT
jgi:3-methyladenine DNA glycosylase AlkD